MGTAPAMPGVPQQTQAMDFLGGAGLHFLQSTPEKDFHEGIWEQDSLEHNFPCPAGMFPCIKKLPF